jgi:hypothetical protein
MSFSFTAIKSILATVAEVVMIERFFQLGPSTVRGKNVLERLKLNFRNTIALQATYGEESLE